MSHRADTNEPRPGPRPVACGTAPRHGCRSAARLDSVDERAPGNLAGCARSRFGTRASCILANLRRMSQRAAELGASDRQEARLFSCVTRGSVAGCATSGLAGGSFVAVVRAVCRSCHSFANAWSAGITVRVSTVDEVIPPTIGAASSAAFAGTAIHRPTAIDKVCAKVRTARSAHHTPPTRSGSGSQAGHRRGNSDSDSQCRIILAETPERAAASPKLTGSSVMSNSVISPPPSSAATAVHCSPHSHC